jgi:hypothetical protein
MAKFQVDSISLYGIFHYLSSGFQLDSIWNDRIKVDSMDSLGNVIRLLINIIIYHLIALY